MYDVALDAESHISKPYHSESRTIWYVYYAGEVIATLELGQQYESTEGGVWTLVDVGWASSTVTVERNGERYVWRIESLINPHLNLLA